MDQLQDRALRTGVERAEVSAAAEAASAPPSRTASIASRQARVTSGHSEAAMKLRDAMRFDTDRAALYLERG